MNRVTARSALLLILTVPAFAQASSFAGSSAGSASAGSAGSSASSDSSSGNDKLVLQARDDAAGFVASAGRLRGAQLEAALREGSGDHLFESPHRVDRLVGVDRLDRPP
jgi:uncharacterized protein (TIGR02448 family)